MISRRHASQARSTEQHIKIQPPSTGAETLHEVKRSFSRLSRYSEGYAAAVGSRSQEVCCRLPSQQLLSAASVSKAAPSDRAASHAHTPCSYLRQNSGLSHIDEPAFRVPSLRFVRKSGSVQRRNSSRGINAATPSRSRRRADLDRRDGTGELLSQLPSLTTSRSPISIPPTLFLLRTPPFSCPSSAQGASLSEMWAQRHFCSGCLPAFSKLSENLCDAIGHTKSLRLGDMTICRLADRRQR